MNQTINLTDEPLVAALKRDFENLSARAEALREELTVCDAAKRQLADKLTAAQRRAAAPSLITQAVLEFSMHYETGEFEEAEGVALRLKQLAHAAALDAKSSRAEHAWSK